MDHIYDWFPKIATEQKTSLSFSDVKMAQSLHISDDGGVNKPTAARGIKA